MANILEKNLVDVQESWVQLRVQESTWDTMAATTEARRIIATVRPEELAAAPLATRVLNLGVRT